MNETRSHTTRLEHPQQPARTARPSCSVTPIEGVGERRAYQGVVQPFVPHEHDHYVFGLVKAGHRTLYCNDVSFDLVPGDMIVFNPGDVHACVQNDEERFAYDSVTVSADLFGTPHLQSPKVSDPQAIQLFQNVLGSLNEDCGSFIKADLQALFDILKTPEPAEPRDDERRQAAQHVLARFCGDLSHTPTLEELAAPEGLSPYALIRAYRKRFSITPMQHLTSLRIECACTLLSKGVEPAFVAAELGFADQAHLTRLFKQRLGITPAAYRKMTAHPGPTS